MRSVHQMEMRKVVFDAVLFSAQFALNGNKQCA